jgi:hypothetical protein
MKLSRANWGRREKSYFGAVPGDELNAIFSIVLATFFLVEASKAAVLGA